MRNRGSDACGAPDAAAEELRNATRCAIGAGAYVCVRRSSLL